MYITRVHDDLPVHDELSGVEGRGLLAEAVQFLFDHAAVEIMGDKDDARTPVVIGPFRQFGGVVKHMLHAMNGNRPFAPRDVQNALYPQEFLAVLADQDTDPRNKRFPVNRFFAGDAERGNGGIVAVYVMRMIVGMLVSVVMPMVMFVMPVIVLYVSLIAQPALNVDGLGFRIVQAGIEQLIGLYFAHDGEDLRRRRVQRIQARV